MAGHVSCLIKGWAKKQKQTKLCSIKSQPKKVVVVVVVFLDDVVIFVVVGLFVIFIDGHRNLTLKFGQ